MGLTPAQQNAVDVRDRTLLVSAAAGSGKTFTLTERIIRSIIDDGKDLSRLLIVTFTKAAASQLKDKVSAAIVKAIEQNHKNPDPDKQRQTQEHLQKQLINLGSANISTIDAFFMEPVRTNFEKLGLPASIRMADDAELLPIREKLMREVLDKLFDEYRAYESGKLSDVGYSDIYTKLIAIISETRDSSKLIPTLCDVYSKLLTSSEGIHKLKKHAERFADSADKPFFETTEGSLLKEYLCDVTEYANKTMSALYEEVMASDVFTGKAIEVIESNATTCKLLEFQAKNGNFDDVIAEFAAFTFGKFTTTGCIPCEELDRAKKIRSSVNDLLKDTRSKYLTSTQEMLSRDFKTYAEIAYLIYDIISKFHSVYSEEKLNRGICEFSDMPMFMLKLLKNEDDSDTEYADQLSQSFDAVYIDEYQDVNEIQDDIFSIIGKNHRFMVGDIKQSIYGFREAEPSIFAEYKSKFELYDKDNATPDVYGGNTIFMSENFRCDKSVIDFTNLVCTSLFGAFAKSIEYTTRDNLNLAKEVPKGYQSPKVIINLISPPEDYEEDTEERDDEDESKEDDADNAKNLSDEAIVVANEIARLIRSEKNANGKPIRASDIKILARSNNHVKPLISAMSMLNIKYSLSSKTELFETAEMKLLIALLKSIDNPHVDVPLCHLMTARADRFEPFFSFRDVLEIRRISKGNKSLFDSVNDYAEKNDGALATKCRDFVSLISSMRIQAGKMAADKLIKTLSFSQIFGEIAQTTAYTFLYDCVCKYVKSNWNSLHSFLEYFCRLIESGTVGGEPDKSQQDAVTIMTIHQSKGLEAKVCFLFGFGKRFNIKNKYNLVYDRKLGPSMKLPPDTADDCPTLEKIRVKHKDTSIRQIFSRYMKTKQVEEEARILYVALTRAQERLYISATLKKPFEEYFSNLKQCVDANFQIKNSMSYIDWILLSLPDEDSVEGLYGINVYEKDEPRLTYPFEKMRAISDDVEFDQVDKTFAEHYSSPLQQSSKEILLSMIPSKIAASKASPDMLDKSVFVSIPESLHSENNDERIGENGFDSEKMIRERIELMRSQKTDFDSILKAEEKPTAGERGTAAHLFLQFCDYERIAAHGVENEIAYLLDNRFISQRTASILDVNKIKSFFKSQLYRDLLCADVVHRELHFRMFRPASDFTQNDDIKQLSSDKMIFVQGSIDLVVKTKDGQLILCDYKTDRIDRELIGDRSRLSDEMRKRHGHQLEQYKYASQKIFGKAPDKIVLFLLSIGECIEV